jgi:hypothetical protein
MKEKVRTEQQKSASPGDAASIFDAVPEPENKNVSVSSGPYLETVPVAGKSVGEVRKRFADRFDIDKESTAIVDGKDAKEDYILKAGEALMFVRHAGEKGGWHSVTISGEKAQAVSPEGEKHSLDLDKLIERITPQMSTGPCILPTGVKAVLSRGHITILVWEKAPAIQRLSWIASDSPSPYGPGTKYRNVRIALPYLVIFAVFGRDSSGHPCIVRSDECFFRNEPLKSLADELCYPGLLNCSKFAAAETDLRYPLSWICTQHLKPTKGMNSKDNGERYAAGLEAVRYCLLETSFNLSSEHHEGNSWYGASKEIDPRIATVERWEEETVKDPLFVLDVPWIKTGHSVTQVAERIFKRLNATDTSVKTSSDLARIINNG